MKKHLNILFLVPRFPAVSETFIVNQIIDLIDRGHTVHIFATEKTNHIVHPKILEYNLLEQTYYSNYPTTLWGRIKAFFAVLTSAKIQDASKLLKTLNIFKFGISALKLSSFFKLVWILKTFKNYDIVHAHFGPMNDYFFFAQECGFFTKAKLITTFHGYDIIPNESERNKLRYDKLIQQNFTVTANTVYTKSLLLNIGFKEENIIILPVGLDTSYYIPTHSKKSNNKTGLSILFIGRIIGFKGVSLIADIAHYLINIKGLTHIEFKIIGSNDEKNSEELEKLLTKIKKFKLSTHIHLLGSKNQKEVIEEMIQADLYIMPGLTHKDGRAENQGLVIQEAQAMEVPVVVTDAGGMQYGLIDNETGFVVKQNDIPQFSEKLELLITNSKLRKNMGKQGRKFVVENYDSKILGKQLEAIYFNLLQSKLT